MIEILAALGVVVLTQVMLHLFDVSAGPSFAASVLLAVAVLFALERRRRQARRG